MGRARIAIAESESHILFSVPQGGLIGIFDKSNEEWDLLKDYRGGSEAFAVNDGFVFSARVGPQEVSRNNHLSPFHAVVLHYDTQTGKIRRLADNRKVPPDYQFETPGVAFMNLRLSEERDSFSLCGMVFHPRDGNRIRSFRGRVRIADGEYSKSTIRRVRQRDLQIGSDKFWVEKAAGSLHDGRSLFLKNQRTLVKFGLHEHELPVDISAIHSIVEKMAISANHRLHPNDPTTRSTPLIDPQPAGYLGDSFAILDATTVQLYSITRMKEVIQANQKYENH